MQYSRRPVLAALAAVILAGGAFVVGSASAVSGGAAVADGTYGFTAKINLDGHACSGALIAPAWVITATTCFPDNPQGGAPAKPITVTVGRTDLTGTSGHTATVTNLIARSGRTVTLAHLDTAITDIAPLSLGSTAPVTGETLKLAGYGRTQTEWVPDRLHSAPFAVTSGSVPDVGLTGANGADACKGDAGGPAFRESNGHTELVALIRASYQHGCYAETTAQQGTTATRTDDITDWIRQQILSPSATTNTHAVTLTWPALAAQDNATYRVYGATTAPVPVDAAHLLTTTTATGYVQTSVGAKQTRYYAVVATTADGHTSTPTTPVAAVTRSGAATDFNADGKDDIATFTRGPLGDGDSGKVYVAKSDGTKFTIDDDQQWQPDFAYGDEMPLSGDFNGDGKSDIATFTRGTFGGSNSGRVYVGLSDGTRFVTDPATKIWQGDFAYGAEVPAVGDFNGDGKDDIATFTRGTFGGSNSGRVYVGLSDGAKFVTDPSAKKWQDDFAYNSEIPAVGDFNGDGKDDIATFTRGPFGGSNSGKVYVGLSDGTKLITDPATKKWQDDFAYGDEVPVPRAFM